MKTLAPLVLLMCCLCHISAGTQLTLHKGECCPGHDRKHVPKHCVARVVMTSNECKLKSMIITTVHNKTFCIDPKLDWAKKLRFTNASPTSNPKKCLKKP